MEWIETVLMEVNGTKQSPFDIEYSKVNLDLDSMKITTTTRTTDLVKVSDFRNWKRRYFVWFIFLQIFQTTTLFSEVWANRGLFKSTLNETLRAYPNFKFYDTNEKIITKPPLYYFENYDFSDVSSATTIFQHSLIFMCIYLCYIILLLCSINLYLIEIWLVDLK